MRILVILRGAPGCGKSTWVRNNGLEPFTLNPDTFRLLYSSPRLTQDGDIIISQKENQQVWNMLFDLLEKRMINGDFTVIDACHRTRSDINKYRELANKYKYKVFCVDFTDININECKKNNKKRYSYRIVPDSVIDKFYAAFKSEQVPSWAIKILPNEVDNIWIKKLNLSSYNKIVHFGDIHGCFKPLKEYFDFHGEINDDTFYIFTGDFIDRGPDNDKVLKFLFEIVDKPNVCLIEGNHEKHLWKWANNMETTKEFENNTLPQLLNAGITQKDARIFCRKLVQMAWYSYGNKNVLCSHGGISNLQPYNEFSVEKNLTLLSTNEYIRGSGKYAEIKNVEKTFGHLFPNVCQVHGHRNVDNLGIINPESQRCYNLEGGVERKGQLRIIEFSGLMKINPVHIDNLDPNIDKIMVKRHISRFRDSDLVKEINFGNISSFNFTKDAFFHKRWNSESMKARGLFINIKTNDVVARSYDKFFNINEKEDTQYEILRETMMYPLTAYVKENGYLGILGWDYQSDKPIFASKSMLHPDNIELTDMSNKSLYAIMFKDIFYKTIPVCNQEKIFDYIKKNNVSFVFEVINPEFDPHIIKYKESQIVLLDIIMNSIKYDCYLYLTMSEIAKKFDLKYKKVACVIKCKEEFDRLYADANDKHFLFESSPIEGFVIKDSSGYMVKIKTHYYNKWKRIRGLLPVILNMDSSNQIDKLIKKNEFDFDSQCIIKFIFNRKNDYNTKTSIITIRDDYLKSI